MGESGGAAGEAAEGKGTGSGHHSARGGGVVARFEDDGRDVGRGDDDAIAQDAEAMTTQPHKTPKANRPRRGKGAAGATE